MEKLINKIKEKDEIIIFSLFLLLSISICLNITISAGDEVWNFQNIYKMYNGFQIYEDINVIITPLFFLIAEMIFKIFTPNLFIFRVSHGILMAMLYLFSYKILKKLNISKKIGIITIFFIAFQDFFSLIRTGFNYNNMAILFILIGLYYLINEKTRKNIIIQVFATMIIFLTKQNAGIFYFLANIIYLSINKINLKEKISLILKYTTGVLILGTIFIIYLILDNNFLNFLNYTFGGMLEFANENTKFDITGILQIIIIETINLVLGIFLIKKDICSEKQKENIKILLIFSTILLGLCYPIFNSSHIMFGTYIAIINLIYMIYLLFKDFIKMIDKILRITIVVIDIIIITFSIYNIYSYVSIITSDNYQYTWEEPFFGGLIEKEEYEKNQKIIKYIQENPKNVIVVSYRAALYMTPLKRNNGDFDLPLKGNFGIKGEQGLIEKVKNIENTQFLICEDKEENCYQESNKVKEYIRNTKKYIGQIEDFEIYE